MQVPLDKSKEGNDKSELRMEWKLFSCLGNCSSLSVSLPLSGQAVCQGHNEQNFRYFRAIRRKTHQEREGERRGRERSGAVGSAVQMTPLKSNVDETAFVVQAARKRMFMSVRLNRACE